MQISHCKILKKTQVILLEFFVLEVAARSAADVLDIHPNSEALFYHKIRQVIVDRLDGLAEEMLGGELSLMSLISAVYARESVVVERQEK